MVCHQIQMTLTAILDDTSKTSKEVSLKSFVMSSDIAAMTSQTLANVRRLGFICNCLIKSQLLKSKTLLINGSILIFFACI